MGTITTWLAIWGALLSTYVAARGFFAGRTSFAVTHADEHYDGDDPEMDDIHMVTLLNRSDRQQTIHYLDFVWAVRTPVGRVIIKDASGYEGGAVTKTAKPGGSLKLWNIPDHDWFADAPPKNHPKARAYIRIAVAHRKRLYWLPYRPVGTESIDLMFGARHWLAAKGIVY